MKLTTDPFILYERLDVDFTKNKSFLNETLMVNTCISRKDIEEINLIDEIYRHVEINTAGYSFSEYESLQNKPMIPKIFELRSLNQNDVKDYKKSRYSKTKYNIDQMNEYQKWVELSLEDAIKNHCIFKALYTITYLLTKDITLKTRQLGFSAQGMGLHDLEAYITDNKLHLPKDERVIPESDAGVWNNRFDSTLSTNYQSQLALIGISKGEKYQSREARLFLSNFSYDVINNQMKERFPFEKLLNTIDSNISNNRLFNRHTKEFVDQFNGINNISFKCQNKSEIDQLLYYYKKELALGYDMICSYFQDKPISGFVEKDAPGWYTQRAVIDEVDDIDVLKLGLQLPNAFSRSHIMRYLSSITEDIYELKDKLLYLTKVVFPIFEHAFIDYFRTTSASNKNPLVSARKHLEEYVTNNLTHVTKNGFFAKSRMEDNQYNVISWNSLTIDKTYYPIFYSLIHFSFSKNVKLKGRYDSFLYRAYKHNHSSCNELKSYIPSWHSMLIGKKEDHVKNTASKVENDFSKQYSPSLPIPSLSMFKSESLDDIATDYKEIFTAEYMNQFIQQREIAPNYFAKILKWKVKRKRGKYLVSPYLLPKALVGNENYYAFLKSFRK